jgi:methylmalonyl-CoA/ethylmalonyl-CoA epimerase
MIKGLHRVSIAVDNLENALTFYRDVLGLTVMEQLELPEHGLRLARLALGTAFIELLQPTDESGALAAFIAHRGMGLHHITIEVEDIEHEMRTLMARGIQLYDRTAREGPDGRVAFIHQESTGGVLIEMTEPAPPSTPAPSATPAPA